MISNEKEFWTVGYSQWGRWQVRKATVDEPDKYTLVEDLGPDLKAAYLEADGDFIYKTGEEHLSLITSGVPWLFVITNSGKLYVKRVGASLDTVILLDTGVIQASTCRGWKSERYSVDSGLLVTYRKSVGVFLREYYRVSGVYTWNPAQMIVPTSANHVEIKRLNDFRIAIEVDNRLFLSDRYYIGGTTKTELLNPNIVEEFDVWSFTANDGEKSDLAVQEVTLHDNTEFWVKANYPFYSRDEAWNDLSLTTSVVSGQGIERWYIEDGLLKIKMKLPVTSVLAYMSFRIRALNRLRFERTPQSRPISPQLDIIYQAPPVQPSTEILSPDIDASWSMRMIEKRNLKVDIDEHLAPDISANLQMTLTKVNNILNVYSERLSPVISATLSPIVVELVGDKPV